MCGCITIILAGIGAILVLGFAMQVFWLSILLIPVIPFAFYYVFKWSKEKEEWSQEDLKVLESAYIILIGVSFAAFIMLISFISSLFK